jgi:excisionase family DNA binding protein
MNNIKEELPHKRYYTPKEVAVIFNVKIKTLYSWMQEGKVAFIVPAGGRLKRISREEVERMKVDGMA